MSKPKIWNENPDYFLDAVSYNADITYNDAILYNSTSAISSVYQPTGHLWNINSDQDDIFDEADYTILDEEGGSVLSEKQELLTEHIPSPILWTPNPGFAFGSPIYNAAVTYNDAINYNGVTTADLSTIYVPTGTIWTGVV